jgi:hypothetical protein
VAKLAALQETNSNTNQNPKVVRLPEKTLDEADDRPLFNPPNESA